MRARDNEAAPLGVGGGHEGQDGESCPVVRPQDTPTLTAASTRVLEKEITALYCALHLIALATPDTRSLPTEEAMDKCADALVTLLMLQSEVDEVLA